MAGTFDRIRSLERRPGVGLVLGLGGAALLLALLAIVGAVAVSKDGDTELVAGPGGALQPGDSDDGTGTTVAPGDATATTAPGDLGTVPGADPGAAPGGAPGAPGAPGGGPAPAGGSPGTSGGVAGETPSAQGATRTGVSQTTIRWGLHAPITFDGAPLALAEDPIEGVNIYIRFINQRGIHGRKIEHRIFDDRYTVSGGRAAANALINDYKPFFASGTLGVDQNFQVASEAQKRGVTYLAAGGPERVFGPAGMYQVSQSYDTVLIRLAEFLGAESRRQGNIYSGRKKVGVFALNSPYIKPSVDVFADALRKNGLEYVGSEEVDKPTEQTTYNSEISNMRAKGAEIVVPVQDPITTSRITAECGGVSAAACPWKWSFANFAHDGDVALDLMGGAWTGVKGLSGACYYLPKGGMNPYDTTKCAQMKIAHDQWVAINGQADWEKDGQGGAAGYQIVNIWTKALIDIGPDPTREKFVAALNSYEGYSNLVSSPITYKGSPNRAHGAEGVVIYEAGSDRKFRQLTPGFVTSF